MTMAIEERTPPPEPRSWRCRGCGGDLRAEVRSIEVILGTCDINVFETAPGAEDVQFGGSTDVDWNNQATAGYECGTCARRVPPAVAAWLAHHLVAPHPAAARYVGKGD
jgi:hypothetical protein